MIVGCVSVFNISLNQYIIFRTNLILKGCQRLREQRLLRIEWQRLRDKRLLINNNKECEQ